METVEILSMLFSAAFTVIGGIVLYKFKQADAERHRRERERALERKHDTERSIKENKALVSGLQAVLRTLLMQEAMGFEKQGFVALREFENFQSMYEAYHSLGGNGLITQLFEEVKHLPHELEAN